MGRRSRTGLTRIASLLIAAALPAAASALTDEALATRLRPRIDNDRTGVCIVAAVIDGPQVARTRLCARPRADGGPGDNDAFEIGSISKTMTAFLLADLVDTAGWTLDDPIASRLPPLPGGASAPRQGQRQIVLRDIVTHSSGLPALPAIFPATDPGNPYASLRDSDLLASLAQARLQGPIGQPSGYSNFAVMLLSLAVARGQALAHPPPGNGPADLEQALSSRLFQPLQMRGAYLLRPPADAHPVQGHTAAGAATPAWTWAAAPDLAGVGGVRATLDDMVRYAQALLGLTDTPLAGRLRATLQPQAPGWGMQWSLATVRGRAVVLHEGATGGFSAALVMEPAAQRAVVILADTALADLGGVGAAALAVLDPAAPMPRARVSQPIPAALRAAAPGAYTLGGLQLRIWNEGAGGDNADTSAGHIADDNPGRLLLQVTGQPAFELLYDDHGDLYPRQGFALLRPVVENGQLTRFAWHQGGGVAEGVRNGAAPPATATNPLWQAWAGVYQLLPQFSLRIFEQDGQLRVQGTAQPAITAEVVGPDRLEIKAVGATLQFQRNAGGQVTGLTLQQHGQVLQGVRRETPPAVQ